MPDDLCSLARAYTDTVTISISPFSGEGWDRDLKGPPACEEGDYYLLGAEKAVCKAESESAYETRLINEKGWM